MEPSSLVCVPNHLKTQEMCKKAVNHNLYLLNYVPDRHRTQKMCNEAMCNNAAAFFLISDHVIAVAVVPWQLHYVPDRMKTQEMCDKAVREDPSGLEYVPLIGLLHNIKQNYGMMTMIIVMMKLLGGMRIIKNARPRKQKLRKNFCLLLGILIVRGIGACQGQKKCGSNMLMWPGEGIRWLFPSRKISRNFSKMC